jgi:uncharacterized RDD family membrane protein YckC
MLDENIENKLVYAGFWQRLGSFLLDLLIFSPLIGISIYLFHSSRTGYLYWVLPFNLMFSFYYIYCVKRWGGTPGKLILGLKILKSNGEEVGWQEAILRFIIDFFIGLLNAIALMIVFSKMTDSQFYSMNFMSRAEWITKNMPTWQKPISWLGNIWVISEFIVILCNDKKRAFHDFIADTIVVKKKLRK